MKSYIEFFTEQYLVLQSIEYLDRTIFRRLEAKDPTLIPSNDIICEAMKEIDGFDREKFNKKGEYLNQDQQVELLKIYKAAPYSEEGMEAKTKIVEAKMKYIYAICQRLVNAGTIKQSDFDDAVSEGVLGLLDAIEAADIEKIESMGYGFTPFARQYIAGRARNAFNPIRQKDLYSGKAGEVMSMDAEISGDRGEWADKDQSIADKIADMRDIPGEQSANNEEKELLKDFLMRLPDKERRAIELYYPENKEDKKTLEEIGHELGMTKVGAKQVVDRAFGKLKEFAKEYGY